MMNRSFTFLGTGTSQGIPVIGCTCDVCQSIDSKDKRLRVSGLISYGDIRVVIDVGPDFRQQMLTQNVTSLEAIVLTHEHNDHIIGLDDIRPLYFRKGNPIPVYGLQRVLEEVKERFSYFFVANPYPGVPQLELNIITKSSPFSITDLEFQPIEVIHGKLPILGYKLDGLVYITDAKSIEDAEVKKIKGCDVLIINALHHNKHHSHFNLEEALRFIAKVAPKQAWLTHMSHMMGQHEAITKQLPENVRLAYDGLVLSF